MVNKCTSLILFTFSGLDPRMWSREDVLAFLRWVEREYDLPSIDHTKFFMNGKFHQQIIIKKMLIFIYLLRII